MLSQDKPKSKTAKNHQNPILCGGSMRIANRNVKIKLFKERIVDR